MSTVLGEGERPLGVRLGRPGRSDGRRARRGSEPYLIGSLAVVAFLVSWQLYVTVGLADPLLLRAPSDVLATGWQLLIGGGIYRDLATSLVEFALGFAAAVAFAVPIGLVAGRYRPVLYFLEPYLTFFFATPRVALLPLLLVWIGIGIELKVVIIALSSFFPIVFNVIAGVRTLDRETLQVARSFGASGPFLLRSIIIPGSVPYIATGLRLGVGQAIVAMVVAELYASNQGIGYLMIVAGHRYRIAELIFEVLLVGAFGLLANGLLGWVEGRASRWRPAVGAGT